MKLFGFEIRRSTEPAAGGRTDAPSPRRYSRQWGYGAANRDRMTAGIPRTPVNISTMIRAQLTGLRASSRWLVENDSYARQFMRLLDVNVFRQTGIYPEARQEALEDADTALVEAVLVAWRQWASDPKAVDMGGRLRFRDAERLFLRGAAEDGETLALKYRGPGAGPFGFSLLFVDPDLLPVQYDDDVRGGNIIRSGVEMSPYWRPVRYHLIDPRDHARSPYGLILPRTPTDTPPWDAADVIHEFLVERAGQYRGIPWLSNAGRRLHNVAGLEQAALAAARAGASQLGAIQREIGAAESNTYDTREDPEDDSSPRILEFEDAVFMDLAVGETLAQFTPNYPHEQYSPFMRGALQGVAASLGVSYASLTTDRSQTNYSSERSGKLDETDGWLVLVDWVCSRFHKPVFREWLEMAILAGKIQPVDGRQVSIADVDDIVDRIVWQSRGWASVDPDKETKADEREIAMGTNSRTGVMRRRGRKPEQVFAELKEEERLGFAAKAAAPEPGDTTPDETTDAEDGDGGNAQ